MNTKFNLFFLLIISVIYAQGLSSHQTTQTFETVDGVKFQTEVVAQDLEVPWTLAFDPDGNLFFTERSGNLKYLKPGSSPQTVSNIKETLHLGEGGLMGLAFHPDFNRTRWIYLSYTYRADQIYNRVVRYVYRNGRLSNLIMIVDELPGARFHNGCKIRFGPDQKLYITTGEATEWNLAQKMNSLGGKILRVNDDGSIPSDNPFRGSPIYTLGHRNPQGLDWHPITGLLFSTEHGPSGFEGKGGGGDELNIIESGKNYGWPVIHHKEIRDGYISPFLEYTPAVAPGGGSFYSGDLFPKFKNNFFFGALRGQHLHRVILDPENPRRVIREENLLDGVYKRIRDVVQGPDGYIYFCTSNQDGRASPEEGDDKILRMKPLN